MHEVGKMEMTLVEDRGVMKWRVNLIKGDRVRGFFKPVRGSRGAI